MKILHSFTRKVLFETDRADLWGANLRGVDLQGANLAGADLSRANLRGADLQGAKLAGAELWKADMVNANLAGANLRGAKLAGAELQGANLSRADLRGAALSRVNLSRAELQGANLAGADLRGVTGNSREVVSIQTNLYPICYTSTNMQIGCENHPIIDWWKFSDTDIIKMGGKTALTRWRKWKPILQEILKDES